MLWIAAALSACATAPRQTVNPGDNAQTRVAEQLKLIPTAAALNTIAPAPTDTARPYPTAAPLATVTASAVTQPTAPAATTAGEYRVAPGDTLSSIAAKNGTSIANLQLTNNLSEQDVRAGATLKLPTQKLAADEDVYWFVHTVKAGETFGAIALRFGVSTAELLRVNTIRDASLIVAGQRLVIPVKQPTRGADDANTVAAAQAAPTAIPVATEPRAVTPIPIAPELILLDTTAEPVKPARAVEPVMDAPAANAALSSAPATGMAATLLANYNAQRATAGIAPLAYSGALQAAAQAHAEECAARGSCSHTGLDGSTSRDRIKRAGYAGKWTGENWAWSQSAEGAFDMWFFQESADGPHRKNIMSPNYSEVGFGIAAFNGGYIFIADLGG
jgi:uncharacterized protein YkwD